MCPVKESDEDLHRGRSLDDLDDFEKDVQVLEARYSQPPPKVVQPKAKPPPKPGKREVKNELRNSNFRFCYVVSAQRLAAKKAREGKEEAKADPQDDPEPNQVRTERRRRE